MGLEGSVRYWKIEGFDGIEKIYEEVIKTSLLSENQLKRVLQTLAAKQTLDFHEIVGSFVRRGSKRGNDLLVVVHHKPEPKYSCGENPFFTAMVINDANLSESVK
jgi:RNase adaptor protein for sRNA GlmZ degradation